MAWTQVQGHSLDPQTRLVCRYHRLTTRFELLILSTVPDTLPPSSTLAGIDTPDVGTPHTVAQVGDVTYDSCLIYQTRLYGCWRNQMLQIGDKAYRLRIRSAIFWRSRLQCDSTKTMVIPELLPVRRNQSLVRWVYGTLMSIIRFIMHLF